MTVIAKELVNTKITASGQTVVYSVPSGITTILKNVHLLNEDLTVTDAGLYIGSNKFMARIPIPFSGMYIWYGVQPVEGPKDIIVETVKAYVIAVIIGGGNVT